MNRGRFITLEGGEGVGKSTQARLLADALQLRGIAVDLTREPGGTAGAEAIRSLLLGCDGEGWDAHAEVLLFAAARADHVTKRILPALEQGRWVICDRFIDSTRAYQGGGLGLPDRDILELHRIGCQGLMPDRTILLEVPPEVTAERLSRRDGCESDAIGGRDAAFHARVAQAFGRLAQAEPDRFVRIAGNREREQTHAAILAAVETLAANPR